MFAFSEQVRLLEFGFSFMLYFFLFRVFGLGF